MRRSGYARSTNLMAYLRDIEATPLLSPLEEQEWADRVAEGDPEARDHMVRANLRLVITIARDYAGRGLSLEDLVAEGNLGLMRAVEGFDPGVGVRFSTYASYWIKQSIRSSLMKLGKFVRLPAHAHTLLSKWVRASTALADRLGREPTPEEVGAELKLSPRKLRVAGEALRAARLAPCRDDDSGEEDHSVLMSADAPDKPPDEIVGDADAMERLLLWLDLLDGREAEVVRLRFGLGSGHPMTLQEIGTRLGGLTRERVRQLERKALDFLSANLLGARETVSA
jgi:RNA polymerase primary sigma factor